MPQPTGEGPQDAPHGQPWPASPSTPDASDPHPPVASAAPTAPTGPNWALVVVGLLLLLAAGAELGYLLGFRPNGDLQVGPQALIATGAVLLLVGAVGSIARRTGAVNRRRQRATRRR